MHACPVDHATTLLAAAGTGPWREGQARFGATVIEVALSLGPLFEPAVTLR